MTDPRSFLYRDGLDGMLMVFLDYYADTAGEV